MTPVQEIAKIDRKISDLYAKIQSLENINPESAESWQAAWDSHPDLKALRNDLCHQREIAQQARDAADYEAAKNNHLNRINLYTVLRPSGEPEAEGCTVSEAASVVLNYDGGSYEVRRADPKWDVAGEPRWDLWHRDGSNGARWACTVIGEYEATAEAAWLRIAKRVIVECSTWRHGCDVVSDADYAVTMAELARNEEY